MLVRPARAVSLPCRLVQAIGISLDELKTIDEENIFKLTIGGLNELGDAFERQESHSFFLKKQARLGSVIAKGAAGFEEAARTVSAFGLVLRRDQVKAVETLNDQINRTKLSIQGLYRQIVANPLPLQAWQTRGILGCKVLALKTLARI